MSVARRTVEVEFDDIVVVDESGEVARPGVRATCSTCGWETQSMGRGSGSRKRCLAMMHEECPLGEDNFYEGEGESD